MTKSTRAVAGRWRKNFKAAKAPVSVDQHRARIRIPRRRWTILRLLAPAVLTALTTTPTRVSHRAG